MTTILAMIFVLGVLVFVHELGHFMAARSVGVKVEKFSLGFPPRLISFIPTEKGWLFNLFFYKRDENGKLAWAIVYKKLFSSVPKKATETEYSVALIPLGGYVKMAGTIDESMDENIIGASYELNSKTRLQQLWVMIAGVLMNLILAAVIFAGLTFQNGIIEPTDEPVVMETEPDYPAAAAGIIKGDRILSVEGTPITTWGEMTTIIHAKISEPVELTWQRGEELFTAQVTTKEGKILVDGALKTVGLVGIQGGYIFRDAGFFESIQSGVISTGNWFVLIYQSIGAIITGKASTKDIGGPILIAQMAGKSAKAGFGVLLSFMAFISVNLAFINILPIPGLDGGHILIIVIESIIRRALSIKVRMRLQQAGMTFLMLLILFVIYNDISRIITQ